MGNCVQSSSSSSGAASGYRHGAGGGEVGCHPAVQLQRRRGEEEAMEDRAAASTAPSVLKVKMVLTKGELGWLVARLKAGDRRLEAVLQEMARKKRENGWRPSLESIVECPAEPETAAAADS